MSTSASSQPQDLEVRLGCCAPEQQSERPDEDGDRRDAEGRGLGNLPIELQPIGVKYRLVAEFGHDMVVVGVEPLGEVEGSNRLPFDVATSGHGEIAVEIERLASGTKAAGDRPHHDRCVKNVVVEGEVVRGNEVYPRRRHRLPIRLAG